MSELIYKQDLINALETDCSWEIFDDWGNHTPTGQAIIETIKKLPSAELQKKGKWIYCEDSTADCVDGYKCDKCGFFVPWDYQHKSIDYIKDYNYCPNCGSYNGG